MTLHSPLKKMLLSVKCNENYGNLAGQKENLTLLIGDLDKMYFSFFIVSKTKLMFLMKVMGKSITKQRLGPIRKTAFRSRN